MFIDKNRFSGPIMCASDNRKKKAPVPPGVGSGRLPQALGDIQINKIKNKLTEENQINWLPAGGDVMLRVNS